MTLEEILVEYNSSVIEAEQIESVEFLEIEYFSFCPESPIEKHVNDSRNHQCIFCGY